MSIIIGYDPVTLKERVDTDAALARLAEIAELRSQSSVAERGVLLRLLGRVDEAWETSSAALRNARMMGDRRQVLYARLRRAQVAQAMGKLDDALREMSLCVDEAATHDWAGIEAFARQHRGKILFDMHELPAALDDFERALAMREANGAPADQVESSAIAVAVTRSFVDEQRSAG